MNARSDGEKLKPESSDFKLIQALLGFHPKACIFCKLAFWCNQCNLPRGDPAAKKGGPWGSHGAPGKPRMVRALHRIWP